MDKPFIAYQPATTPPEETTQRAQAFNHVMASRRTVRQFDATRDVPRATIEAILATASSAPSGAHKQPWTFVAISNDELKQKIRTACEEQERHFYDHLAPPEWLEDLAPLGTDFVKEHITDAPWVVILFAQKHGWKEGQKAKHYYVQESCGIAAGFLIAAVHQAGLATLTHTPSPMKFLAELLGRPSNEEAFLLLPIGYPASDCTVPDLARKPLEDVIVWETG